MLEFLCEVGSSVYGRGQCLPKVIVGQIVLQLLYRTITSISRIHFVVRDSSPFSEVNYNGKYLPIHAVADKPIEQSS